MPAMEKEGREKGPVDKSKVFTGVNTLLFTGVNTLFVHRGEQNEVEL